MDDVDDPVRLYIPEAVLLCLARMVGTLRSCIFSNAQSLNSSLLYQFKCQTGTVIISI